MKLFHMNRDLKLDDDKITRRSRLFTGYLCNIKCKFCFYKNMKHVDIKDKIEQQVIQGHKYGIKDWDISGGEPSILPYWFAILEDLKSFGFRNIACITNGYKFANIDFLKKSVDLGMNELLFSLHGADADSHDGMTGVKGSYGKLMQAITNAKNIGIKIRINTVVAKDNYKDLSNIVEIVNAIQPVAFNFLPFRLENSAPKENVISYTKSAPYIKRAIDHLDKTIKISVRYLPFCIMRDYEEYVCMYIQRLYDEYEWSEHSIRMFEYARKNKDVPQLANPLDRVEAEKAAINKTTKKIGGFSTQCLRCNSFRICDGIWSSYQKVFGTKEFQPIDGEKVGDIEHWKKIS